jgi:hypothetical protein
MRWRLTAHINSVTIVLHEGNEATVSLLLGGATKKSQPTAKRVAKMA